LKEVCYGRVVDEFVTLKDQFGQAAATSDEDWAYWWMKHHQTFLDLRHGGAAGGGRWLVAWPVFEVVFGWGVRLGNLGVCLPLIAAVFAVVYRRVCPETRMQFNGAPTRLAEVPWFGLFYMSFMTLLTINPAVDFGVEDHRFRYLNAVEAVLGFIIVTFFVGAYTRMILAA
jgi:hypothetical protein